ncbi:hypothetical protein BD408DRAFT_419237 [Parasitella parasitica]|nr:hypothetical protein BD408DRAFT_419237 [Parasitella parasitica]
MCIHTNSIHRYKCHHMKKLLTGTSNQDSEPFYSAFLIKKKAELDERKIELNSKKAELSQEIPNLDQEIANLDLKIAGLEKEMANVNLEKADLNKVYEGYAAATDWTGAYFYKELLKLNPDAKVILTERPFEEWYTSVEKTIYRAVTEKEEAKPDSPYYFFGQLCRKMILDGKIADKEAFSDKEAIKAYYDDHIQRVKDNVPEKQLYCLKLGEGWEGLCKFLDKPVPTEPYPNLNSSAHFKKRFDVKNTDTDDSKTPVDLLVGQC